MVVLLSVTVAAPPPATAVNEGVVDGFRLGEDVYSFGEAGFYGSTSSVPLNQPIVGIAPTHTGNGYWILARDGGVFSYGDAVFHGSTGNLRLNHPIVSLAADPRGRGYWFVAADGGVFAFGPPFLGSTGGVHLTSPIVGMAPTRTGNGYWLVARDGGVFAFGDAAYAGSAAGRTPSPIVGIAADPDGAGYWLAAEDGAVWAFDAPFHGDAPGILSVTADHVVGIAAHGGGSSGYYTVTRRGTVYRWGGAYGAGDDLGDVGHFHPWPIIGIAGHPSKSGFWLVTRQVPIGRRPIGDYFVGALTDGIDAVECERGSGSITLLLVPGTPLQTYEVLHSSVLNVSGELDANHRPTGHGFAVAVHSRPRDAAPSCSRTEPAAPARLKPDKPEAPVAGGRGPAVEL